MVRYLLTNNHSLIKCKILIPSTYSCIVHISLLNQSILYRASNLALDLYIYLDPHLLSFWGKKGFKIKDNFSNFMNVSFYPWNLNPDPVFICQICINWKQICNSASKEWNNPLQATWWVTCGKKPLCTQWF